jgi:enoyl-CoA hydratase/carnithine racemase
MDAEFDTAVARFDQETGIGTVLMNRPDSLNALNGQLRDDIIASLEWLDARNEDAEGVALRAVVLEGAGGNFCAGADINEFEDHTLAERDTRPHYEVIMDFPVPVIAKIEGYCLGGGFETALACDFRLVHAESRLGLPEVGLGIIPGAGGIQFVSRLANPSVAMELAMTTDHVSGREAHDLGLVNGVFDEDEFDEGVLAFVEKIASQPPLAVQAAKRSATMAVQSGLNEGREYDYQQVQPLFGTDDHAAAVRGFAEEDFDPTFEGQ